MTEKQPSYQHTSSEIFPVPFFMTKGERRLVRFEPDVLIEIDDGAGGRKMVKVLADGVGYAELADGTSKPIYEDSHPEEVGNILGWGLYLVDQRPEQYAPWEDLVTRMIESGLDPLTYNRGLLWAFRAENYSFGAAYEAGLAATAKVRELADEL